MGGGGRGGGGGENGSGGRVWWCGGWRRDAVDDGRQVLGTGAGVCWWVLCIAVWVVWLVVG